MSMGIKNVVKVMNFHSLLRVDSAKRHAEKYMELEREVTHMIDRVVNNRNFHLDQRILIPDEKKPELNIYLGSDFGFCSNYNSQVNELLMADRDSEKILIGRKIRKGQSNVIWQGTKETYEKKIYEIEEILERSLRNREHSRIQIIYNRYNNASDIIIEKKTVYPMALEEKSSKHYGHDFVVEGDIDHVLETMMSLYLSYTLKICTINSSAAENVMRQNVTRESLKKIDEREEESLKVYRKEKKAREFRKVIESFAKMRKS